MRGFIRTHLGPADFLGEILFGLIMALGFTGAVRLGNEQADSRELFIGILGCNIAWAIVDGVMYALTELFERGRRARIGRDALAASTDDEALRIVSGELDDSLGHLTTAEQRQGLAPGVLAHLRTHGAAHPRLRRPDVMGGLAVALVILACTLPIVAPLYFIETPETAVRISNAVALTLLFLLGTWWGRVVGLGSIKIGFGLTAIGMALVGVTIALGG